MAKVYTASATILTNRFTVISGPHTAAQAGANAKILGISQEGGRSAPLADLNTTDPVEAAQAGEQLNIHMPGEQDSCLLTAGGAVSAGDELASDASGRGVAATTGQNVGAIAQEDGAADELIKVIPWRQTSA